MAFFFHEQTHIIFDVNRQLWVDIIVFNGEIGRCLVLGGRNVPEEVSFDLVGFIEQEGLQFFREAVVAKFGEDLIACLPAGVEEVADLINSGRTGEGIRKMG